jgi:hypothetical protein
MPLRKNDPLTLERCRELLSYEPETGLLRWRVSYGNKRIKGNVAGRKVPPGYISLSLDGLSYFAHRLGWLLTHGKWPPAELDHINGDKSDNRLDNLREADRVLNMQNLKRPHRGQQSGLLGVYAINTGGFISVITVNKQRVYLGYYQDAQVAHEAYLKAKRELHPGNTL